MTTAKEQKKDKPLKNVQSKSVLRQVTRSEDFLEQRKPARLDISIKARYKVSAKGKTLKDALTKNVSAGGCLVLATEEIPVDSEVEVTLFLNKTGSDELALKGKIVRSSSVKEGLYEYGVSFSPLTKEERTVFADFCFSKMYEMIGLSEWPTDRRSEGTAK